MSNVKSIERADIGNPQLRKLAKHVELQIRLAGEKVVANHATPSEYKLSSDPNSYEQILATRFKALRPEKQEAAKIKVMSFLAAAPARKAVYGDLAAINLKSDVAVEAQAKQKGLPADLKGDSIHGLLPRDEEPYPEPPEPEPTEPVPPAPAPQSINRLQLRVREVRCVDETGGWVGEHSGNDEIALGGTAVDETGDAHKIEPFTVRSDFDDGERQAYSPPRAFTGFDILEGNQWPKSYFVTLVLAEKDMGGVSDFVQLLFEKVEQEVITWLTASLGGAIGASGGVVGAIIGAAVGWIVGKVFEWFKAWWSDDIFAPVTVSTTLDSLESRWNGATNSPAAVATFKGHDGEYTVTYDWCLYAA